MGDTRTDLVKLLLSFDADLLTAKGLAARDEIVERARRGDFHCFKSALDAPKIALVNALRAGGFADLAQCAENGAWDEAPDASDREALAREVGGPIGEALRGNRADRRAARKRAGN